MTIDWNNFTPWASLSGGLLLGLAASALLLFSGRVLGISGIVGGLLTAKKSEAGWRWSLLAGMFAAPWAWRLFVGEQALKVTIEAGTISLIVAGLLVGIGTRYGSGCTSGHGVCGLSRFSLRSLVATLSFMAAGFVTVFVLKHWLGA